MNRVPPGSSQDAEFGPLLARMRKHVGQSQLSFALTANISSRHLSFLESGRARPSAVMVDRLAKALHATPQETARLKHAAGYAVSSGKTAGRIALSVDDSFAVQAFDAASEIQEAESADHAATAAARFLEKLGITHFATGEVRRTDGVVEIEMDRAGRPAFGWLQHFAMRGYRNEDALVARTAAGSGAFFWSDLDKQAMRASSRRILDEARDFGVCDGFVVSIPRHDGSLRAFTSWAGRIDTDPRSRLAARLVATTLIESGDRLGRDVLERRLPKLHRQLLGAVHAMGDVDGISRELGMTGDAVRIALACACRDMGAKSPAEAAERAAKLGLLAA